MNMILSTTIPESKKPGIYGWSDIFYNNHVPFWKQFWGAARNSKRMYEEIVGVNTFTQARRHTEGGEIAIMKETQGYKERVYMVYYNLGYILTVEEINQNLYMELSQGRSTRLAEAHVHRREQEAADIAFNLATSLNRGDGVPFLSNAHPTYAAGTQDNLMTAQLSEAALETAWLRIRTMKDGSGNLKKFMPKDLHVHPNNFIYAQKLLGTEKEPETANNTKNVVRGYIKNVYDNPYMDDTDQWLVTTDVITSKTGAIAFEQVKSLKEIQKLPSTFNTLYAEAQAYSHVIGDWRIAVGYAS